MCSGLRLVLGVKNAVLSVWADDLGKNGIFWRGCGLNRICLVGSNGGQARPLTKANCTLDYLHTFGSQLAIKDESLYKISTVMGSSPEICRRHYAALPLEAIAEAVEFAISRQSRFAITVADPIVAKNTSAERVHG